MNEKVERRYHATELGALLFIHPRHLTNTIKLTAGKSPCDIMEEGILKEAIPMLTVKGAFFLTQKALPYITNGGGIVNVSTGLTRFSFPGYAVYAAMKAGIETLTRYQAKELGERRIRVNVIAPGAIGPILTEVQFVTMRN